jgi:hypothetical protein
MLEENEINQSIMLLSDSQFLYRLDDSLMWLFNTDTGEYWNLNEQSYFTLSLFDGTRTVGKICQLYIEMYMETGLSKELLMEDFKSMVGQFISAKVIAFKEIDNEQTIGGKIANGK